jgi:molybdenum cofactor cytidylyltransferase
VAEVDCLLLAAGSSSRMGRWKMLLPWRGSTVVETAAVAALEHCSRLLLVVGHRGDELARLFAGRDRVEVVWNRDHERGLFSSIRAGVAGVGTARFFVALGDMPMVDPRIYRRLLEAPPAPVLRPAYLGRRGHPVLLSAQMIPLILAEPPESTMRNVLARVDGRDMDVQDAGVVLDLDEPADYERLSGR